MYALSDGFLGLLTAIIHVVPIFFFLFLLVGR